MSALSAQDANKERDSPPTESDFDVEMSDSPDSIENPQPKMGGKSDAEQDDGDLNLTTSRSSIHLMERSSVVELEKIAEQSTGCAKCFLDNLLQNAWCWWWGYVIFNLLWLGVMLYLTLRDERDDEEWFWISFVIKVSVLSVVQVIAGWGVQRYNWKVGYTRKCVHVGFFLLPQVLDNLCPMPTDDEWLWATWNVLLVSLMLLMITRPIREPFAIIRMMYAAVDRKEDKGLTMLYTFMQVPLTIIVITGFRLLFQYWLDKKTWILAPIIAVTFGDGLAEPVAVFWNGHCGGTHKYQTGGLCAGDKKFTRSYEGSACVFLFTAIGILIVYTDMTITELVFNLCVMPITTALLEAIAPHSMDNPFLLTWGCLCMIMAHGVSQAIDEA